MTAQIIPLSNLALAFIPALLVMGILFYWSLDTRNALYAMVRMLVQLLLIGYVLSYIFNLQQAWIILLVLTMMVLVSTWIALGTIKAQRKKLYKAGLLAIGVGGGLTLILITQLVLDSDPWYQPQIMIPIAGMIFSNAMNAISLAAERLQAELDRAVDYTQARTIAFQAALIPMTNALFAVGLVSLPGMMTGQILSGVSPLIAARYQIMVMCMIFGASGIATAYFLYLVKPLLVKSEPS